MSQNEIFSNENKDWITISDNKFKFYFCGDITIKLFNNKKFSNKKLGRIAFNTGFLENDQK